MKSFRKITTDYEEILAWEIYYLIKSMFFFNGSRKNAFVNIILFNEVGSGRSKFFFCQIFEDITENQFIKSERKSADMRYVN